MTLIHLVVGFLVVGLMVAAGIAYVIGSSPSTLNVLAGWALGLLIVQVTTGVFLLTATEEGPGPIHIAAPVLGLVVVGIARLVPHEDEGRDPLFAVVYSLAAIGALAGLVTGIVAV